MEEIRRSPWGEVAWYFSETREQYRLQGRLTVVSSAGGDAGLQAARLRAWQRMSDPGRQQFTWPQSGAPRNEASEAAFAAEVGLEGRGLEGRRGLECRGAASLPPPGKPDFSRNCHSHCTLDIYPPLSLQPPSRDSPAAEAFCLVFMEVEEADHLRLATNQRERYTRAAEGSGGGGGWRVERVNP